MIVSFAGRGLSAIRANRMFCYTAISSAGIVGILPGYLIRQWPHFLPCDFKLTYRTVSSSLELASKNIVCGSVRMVYALIYTLFLVRIIEVSTCIRSLIDKC